MKYRIALLFALALLAYVAAAQDQEAPAPEPRALLEAAVEQLQAASSFRLAIEQSGEPYQLTLSFDGVNMLGAGLTQAEAQVISPNELYISASLRLIIPLSLAIYAQDDQQWLSFPRGAPWLELPAFEDFDISRLLSPGEGIDQVMTQLHDPQLAEAEALVDEQPAWHIQATAPGAAVEVLLFGLIEPTDDVEIDAYINLDDGRLALIEILMLETALDPDMDPTVWHIKFYDYDAPRGFDAPE